MCGENKRYVIVGDVMNLNLLDLIIVAIVILAFLKWTIIVPGLTIVLDIKIKNIFLIFFLWLAIVGLGYADIMFIYRLAYFMLFETLIITSISDNGDISYLENEFGIWRISVLIINLVLILPVLFSLYCLLSYQLKLILGNVTTIEQFEVKALTKKK